MLARRDGKLILYERGSPRLVSVVRITSSAFEHGGTIPARYTCDGKDTSPPLRLEDVPPRTASLALIMDDPDAPMGTFVHWVVWNIPPAAAGVPEGREPAGVLGRNDFGRKGYGGPCPPRGTHRYFFKLYALDARLDLPENSGKNELEIAMKGHVVDQAVLIGRYSR